MEKIHESLRNLDVWVESHYGDWIDDVTNRLRGVVVDSSNFLRNYSLPIILTRKVSKEQFLMICLLSTYLPEDLRAMVQISLKEKIRRLSINVTMQKDARGVDEIRSAALGFSHKAVSQETYFFLENVLCTGNYGKRVFVYYLEERRLWRWFYGSVAQGARLGNVRLEFTSKRMRRPKKVQRKRGYNDHGSKRDDTKVYPGPDVTPTKNQMILDELQETYHEELRLRYTDLCKKAGVPTQLNFEREVVEKLWKIQIRKR
jgi:hypothetical protein